MRYRRIAGTDLTVSVLGLGGNNFDARLDEAETRGVVHAALDAGVTFFDTADLYGASPGGGEVLLGKALKGSRDSVLIGTKFGMDLGSSPGGAQEHRGSRSYITRSVESSLRRLGTDYIDLYQYHEPDGLTPLAETIAALDALVESGKVRHVGCSNFSGALLRESTAIARAEGIPGFVTVQACYHLLDRSVEADVLPACVEDGLALLPYYPLANGLLSGKYRMGEPAPAGSRMSWRTSWFTGPALTRVEALRGVAHRFGASLLELAIAWLAERPAVRCVVAGAMSPQQVAANAAAAAWKPSSEAMAAIDDVVPPGTKVV